MKLECCATTLNLRSGPDGPIVGEMRQGDLIEVENSKAFDVWIEGTVLTGVHAGRTCFARRRYLIEHFEASPKLAKGDRSAAGKIVADRTAEFDAIHYDLGTQPRTWTALKKKGSIDCSGWTYLVAQEILKEYSKTTSPSILATYSDNQIAKCGAQSQVISGRYVKQEHFAPGVLVGIDFAEYSWDRGRTFDIDHVVMIGTNGDGPFVSQSSSTGGGVNKVPLSKWLASNSDRIRLGRVHLVDLLSLS